MTPHDIEELLKVEYGAYAYNISNVYKWHSRTIIGYTDPQEQEKPGIKRDEQLFVRITQELEAEPYVSVRNIAHNSSEAPSIVWR